MKVALVGASGNVGSRILAELVGRHHQVTAIVRHPEKIASSPNVVTKQGDAGDADGLSRLLAGHDAVISSVMFVASDPAKLIEAVTKSGVRRYLVVGGAGSLEVAPGVKLIETPEFPEMYKAEAAKGGAFLDRLRHERDLEWTFLSPSAMFVPGDRTGKFRLGKDRLLIDAAGGSSISFEDFAIALVDELENPKHSRIRFTVGY